MKRIIALSGHSKCGKTTSLLYLIEGIRADIENHPPYPIGKKDKRELFLYHGERVFVCTMGDTCEIVNANIKLANENRAHVLVTATRTTRGSYEVVKQYAASHGFVVENYCKGRQYNMSDKIKDVACKKTAEIIQEALK